MKSKNILVLVVLFVAICLMLQATGSDVSAGETVSCYPIEGCTPGYWKQEQHFDSWVGFAPTDSFADVFDVGPDVTLLEALDLGGGDDTAFMRHAVAALLNASHPNICYAGKYGNDWEIQWFVKYTFIEGTFEYKKDILEAFNEARCPLD